MAENKAVNTERQVSIRHRGRSSQVWIYLGKMLRMFVYQSDWKVVPMSALIAGLVGMVIRKEMFATMEGSLMGAFSLIMVCIWNGFFNSIQVICRERDVIKREHRSGMHISSYICAHMIYQAMLCMLQTGVTLYIISIVGVKIPEKGLFTRWMIADLGISLFLVAFAADMLSLWISSMAKTTTAAMTIMPFVLIFQLVFSGGMLKLPAWTDTLTHFTISNPALKVVTSQTDYNNLPVMTIWTQVEKMRDDEISVTVTPGDVMNFLGDENIPAVYELREKKVSDYLGSEDIPGLSEILKSGEGPTVGELIDRISSDPEVQAYSDEEFTFVTTIDNIVEIIGEDRAKEILQNRVGEANYNEAYENTKENISGYWGRLVMFALIFAALAMISLEFIDKDKR